MWQASAARIRMVDAPHQPVRRARHFIAGWLIRAARSAQRLCPGSAISHAASAHSTNRITRQARSSTAALCSSERACTLKITGNLDEWWPDSN